MERQGSLLDEQIHGDPNAGFEISSGDAEGVSKDGHVDRRDIVVKVD